MGLAALASVVTVLDEFLGVVPRATGVGEEDRHQGAGPDGTREIGAERSDAEREPDGDRRQDGQQTGRGELAQGVLGADVDDAPVLRLLAVVHDPGVLAELPPHLVDHGPGRPRHRVDRQPGEEEDDRGTEDQAHQIVGLRDVQTERHLTGPGAHVVDRRGDRVAVGTEERRRRQNRGGDGDALGDGLGRVADGVQVGEDLRAGCP